MIVWDSVGDASGEQADVGYGRILRGLNHHNTAAEILRRGVVADHPIQVKDRNVAAVQGEPADEVIIRRSGECGKAGQVMHPLERDGVVTAL